MQACVCALVRSRARAVAWVPGASRELELLRRVLAENPYDRDDLWLQLAGHLAPGEQREACYNLEEAWDELHETT